LVQSSYNKVEREYGEEVKNALDQISQFIEKSGNTQVDALFYYLMEELNKPQPDKSRLKSFFSGIQSALPSIVSISAAVAKVVSLFA
jgi:hypothetical protein